VLPLIMDRGRRRNAIILKVKFRRMGLSGNRTYSRGETRIRIEGKEEG